jgi:hypothetical protein
MFIIRRYESARSLSISECGVAPSREIELVTVGEFQTPRRSLLGSDFSLLKGLKVSDWSCDLLADLCLISEAICLKFHDPEHEIACIFAIFFRSARS